MPDKRATAGPPLHELIVPALVLLMPFIIGGLAFIIGKQRRVPTGGLSSSLWFVEPILLGAGFGVLCSIAAFSMSVGRGPRLARWPLMALEALVLASALFLLHVIFE